ncbi:hypothetical protein GGR51DRAFT_514655 [Nemania sp. FL0031]|nr:hypothetical protein GGR51DRAFT_514655 [Nemania sp. FL0031]
MPCLHTYIHTPGWRHSCPPTAATGRRAHWASLFLLASQLLCISVSSSHWPTRPPQAWPCNSPCFACRQAVWGTARAVEGHHEVTHEVAPRKLATDVHYNLYIPICDGGGETCDSFSSCNHSTHLSCLPCRLARSQRFQDVFRHPRGTCLSLVSLTRSPSPSHLGIASLTI